MGYAEDVMASKGARKRKSAGRAVPANVRGKTVGDSFTIPAAEHKRIGVIKKNCLGEAVYVKKCEVIRVGLLLAAELSTKEFLKRWEALRKLSPGRPRKSKKRKSR